MLDWYRKLIELRQTTPSLNNAEPGNTVVSYSEEHGWLRVTRGLIGIVTNLAPNTVLLPVQREAELILASRPDTVVQDGGITLPPESAAVLLAIPEH